MQISDMAKTVLRSAAPTLLAALALPPPFNLIASAVVSGAMAKYLPPGQQPAQTGTDGSPALSPEQVGQVVERSAKDPQFLLDLRRAEDDLKKFEVNAQIRFAELELQDREGSRRFQSEANIAPQVFDAGMSLVKVAMVGMLIVVVGSLFLVFGGVKFDPSSSNLAVAAFGLIGTAVGFVNGVAASIVNFYWGSSQGSKDKATELASTVRDLGQQLGRAASRAPAPPLPVPAPTPEPTDGQGQMLSQTEPARPAPAGLLAEIMPGLTQAHRHFPDGVSWQLTPEGISVDGAPASGTAGEPSTVRGIWKRYGDLCSASAKRYGVPVELIVATIATESRGDPNARRPEPKIRDESVGLMQTLVNTARGALGRRDLSGDHLLDPGLSIEAGTAYIAQQRGSTHFDPPLVAAAYNAGSIRRDDGPANRWKLLVFPTGTGRHVDNFVEWFADCMRVSAAEQWGAQEGVPSFAGCFATQSRPQA
ncbi:transglycosylase SLT domain-containing protein [Roseomonas harenae]|uniref:transglycosylase SLT domain-containing protein n=1 Tax=Muricoccus harenae TaxID=2692566 RepID=UPI001331BC5D|nr:transglycosylase SLT domain-containing protein [Roseomonas harenae]